MRASSLTPALVIGAAIAANTDVYAGNNGSLLFTESNVPASVGDTITFHFATGNHSVVQGSLADPCAPLSGGFNSGFLPAADGDGDDTASPIMFVVTITTTDPIYYYCSQPGHCMGGMVGAVNAPDNGTGSFDSYSSAALSASALVIPSAVGGGVFVNTMTSPAWTSTAPALTAAPTTTSKGSGSGSGSTTAKGGSSATGSSSAASATPTNAGSRVFGRSDACGELALLTGIGLGLLMCM